MARPMKPPRGLAIILGRCRGDPHQGSYKSEPKHRFRLAKAVVAVGLFIKRRLLLASRFHKKSILVCKGSNIWKPHEPQALRIDSGFLHSDMACSTVLI